MDKVINMRRMALDKNQVWKDVLASVRVSVSEANYKTWLAQTYLLNAKEENNRIRIKIGCPSTFTKATVETRYYGLVQQALTKILDKQVELVFEVKQGPKVTKSTIDTPLFEKSSSANDVEKLLRTNIRPGFTFENFAVSSTNQMAWAASDAVSRDPGSSYNPLFIWGGVGVGKTHLMFAIGHYLVSTNTSTEVLFCTGEQFTNDIVEGIRNKATPAVRAKYRKLKALLVDDIQFIAGKNTVQEEFFHTFNSVTSAGGQVVMTSDKPPSEIPGIEERLRSRFEGGLLVDISPPDFELRCAITQIKATQKGLVIPNDLIQMIAGNVDSARKIQGFLIKLQTEIRIKNAEINSETITKLLGKSDDEDQRLKATPAEIITAVSQFYSINKKILLGPVRSKPVARPRQILMYLLRKELKLPLQEVGRLINRDHTTVIHAVKKIAHLASSDVYMREDIVGIKNML